MQDGQYILNRWMVPILFQICEEKDIVVRSFSDNWIFELEKEETVRKIFGYKFDINNSASSEIAGDKVATYQLLKAHNISAVEHRLIRTKASLAPDWPDNFNKKVVIKPLDGTSGHGIRLFSTIAQSQAHIEQKNMIAAWAASPYEEIESERRYIILDQQVLCRYKKEPIQKNGLKMFNLGLGAQALTLSMITD